jgi:predicted nucleic acid-binding protein
MACRWAAKNSIAMPVTNLDRVTLDTNVLVYAFDRDAGERRDRAIEVIKSVLKLDCVLTLQALSEFFITVTRKGKLSLDDAHEQIRDWQSVFPVVTAKPATLSRAITAVKSHHLAFWDAMLWATARESGVTLLISEDFQDGQILESVRIVNPFQQSKGSS